jgi:hypothetical protein
MAVMVPAVLAAAVAAVDVLMVMIARVVPAG